MAAINVAATRPAAADMKSVAGDDIRALVVGRTVDLDTPLRSPITITYKDNGTMSATAGTALSIYLGAASDRGRWWVDNGRLCQKFFKWLEAETSCLRLKQDGSRIVWARDDGRTGTATITTKGPVYAQTGYGLGAAVLAAPSAPSALVAEASPAAAPARSADAPADRTPAIDTPHPRPILAALTPAVAIEPPAPSPVSRPAAALSHLRLPGHWPTDADGHSEPSATLRGMVAAARQSNAEHRWCHQLRDFRLLLRPQALDAQAPELLTAARHMQAPEFGEVPAASCLVPAPALQEVARQLFDAR